MSGRHAELIDWCGKEISQMRRITELIESGQMQTRSRSANTEWEDTSQQTVEEFHRRIAELEALMSGLGAKE